MENVHPGSFVGDSVEEFKKLPTWGKALCVAILGLVAFLAWRAHAANSSAQNAAAASLGGNPTGSAGAATAGTQSPFPMIGSLPLLPNNVNPLFDSAGNPIAYQQNPPPTVPSSPTTPTNPTHTIIVTPHAPGIPKPPAKSGGPLIPYGQYKGPSYSNLKPGTKYTYQGTTYTLKTGAQGRLYGDTAQGHQVLLYGPRSAYGNGGSSGAMGDGGFSMFAFMEDPLVYLMSAHPHTPSTVG